MPHEGTGRNGRLPEQQQIHLERDLIEVRTLRDIFVPRGIKGAYLHCPRCRLDHYLDWELIADGLEQSLDTGHPRIHEPAVDPDPSKYVSWDYAVGLLDGYESFRQTQDPGISVHVVMRGDQ